MHSGQKPKSDESSSPRKPQGFQPPEITRLKHTKDQYQQQIEDYDDEREMELKQSQEMILVPKDVYENMKKEIQKLKFENYALKIELEKTHKKMHKKKGFLRQNNYFLHGSQKQGLDSQNMIEEMQEQDQNDIEQNLMTSWHPNMHQKTSIEQKKDNDQKKKFKKQMTQWSKQIGDNFNSFKKKEQKNNSSQQTKKKNQEAEELEDINKLIRKTDRKVVNPFQIKDKDQHQPFEQTHKYHQRKSEDVFSRVNQTEQIYIENDSRHPQMIALTESDQIGHNFVSMCEIPPSSKQQLKEEQQQCSIKGSIKSEEKKQKKKSESKTKKQLAPLKQHLIESICLFGPSKDKLIKECEENVRKFSVPQQLLYHSPKNEATKQKYGVYGEYFYPEEGQVVCRKIKEDEKNTQAHQVIFRKNAKKQECSLFMFRGDELWEQMYGNVSANYEVRHEESEWVLINKVNAGKMLFGFVMPFTDYTIVEHEKYQNIQKQNKSFEAGADLPEQKLSNRFLSAQNKQAIQGKKSDRQKIGKTEKVLSFVKCKYNLCIFTYFPLVNPIEQLLVSIIDEIKIKRVERYANSDSNINQVTVNFFIEELELMYSEIMKSIQKISTKTLLSVSSQEHRHVIAFRNKKVEVDLTPEHIYETMFAGWVFQILKMFEKDQFYDLLNAIIFEQSVCFVSQNLSQLTHVIFLFVSVLLHPFPYPYPAISLILDLQFLDSPFIVTAGICKSSKWLSENHHSLNSKKIYVDLNSSQLKIRAKNKPRALKSQKLRKIFTNFYKKLPDTMPDIFKKKQTVIRPVTKDQNYNALLFIQSLRRFYQDEIILYLPNPEIITYLKNTIKEQNQTAKMFHLLKEVQKYVRQSRKQKEKDHFVDSLLQQQVFYFYVSQRYGLQ